jgi:hypothetical protein
MALIALVLLAIVLFLLTIAALLAGAVGIAYVLRWVWPAIDPGSATIVGLMALLVTIQLARRFISLMPSEEVETEEEDDDDDNDEEEARQIKRVLWRVRPDAEVYIPKRRRRKRRGRF